MSGELADEHVVAICQVLSAHHVSFVIIGGIAARLHQTGYATVDVDVCPARDESNLGNLAAALRSFGARLRVAGDPDGLEFDPHPSRATAWTEQKAQWATRPDESPRTRHDRRLGTIAGVR